MHVDGDNASGERSIEIKRIGWSVHRLTKGRGYDKAMEYATRWCRLDSSLNQSNALTRCQLWLENDGKEYWWKINEAAILSPFLGLNHRASLNITAHLPSHAVDDVPVPLFTIYRHDRRWHFASVDARGRLSTRFRVQYPLLGDEADLEAARATIKDPSQPVDIDDLRAKWDVAERSAWRAGYEIEGQHFNFGCPAKPLRIIITLVEYAQCIMTTICIVLVSSDALAIAFRWSGAPAFIDRRLV